MAPKKSTTTSKKSRTSSNTTSKGNVTEGSQTKTTALKSALANPDRPKLNPSMVNKQIRFHPRVKLIRPPRININHIKSPAGPIAFRKTIKALRKLEKATKYEEKAVKALAAKDATLEDALEKAMSVIQKVGDMKAEVWKEMNAVREYCLRNNQDECHGLRVVVVPMENDEDGDKKKGDKVKGVNTAGGKAKVAQK